MPLQEEALRGAHKLNVFKRFAMDLAELSNCKRSKVGCVLVTDDYSRVLAIGYNGPPAGESNDSCTSEEGDCGCVHAEANALVKLTLPCVGLKLITTRAPCRHCAGLIVNAKSVEEVYWVSPYRDGRGLFLLQQAGMRVMQLSNERPR